MTKARNIRLYIEVSTLSKGQQVVIEDKRAHYLIHVMRVVKHDEFAVFNGNAGEWLAKVIDVSKKNLTIEITEQTREQTTPRELHLCFAPLKRDPLHFLIEKATELGVTHFHPIITERTIVRNFKTEKHLKVAIEAAEQCERLDIPAFEPEIPLDRFLYDLSAIANSATLYFCDESREANFVSKNFNSETAPYILVGPEGGFTPSESTMIKKQIFSTPIKLHENILRAETAAIAAISQIYML